MPGTFSRVRHFYLCQVNPGKRVDTYYPQIGQAHPPNKMEGDAQSQRQAGRRLPHPVKNTGFAMTEKGQEIITLRFTQGRP